MKYVIFSAFSFILFLIFSSEASFILLNENFTKIGSIGFRELLIIHSITLSIYSLIDTVKYILYYKRTRRIIVDNYLRYPDP